MSSILQDLRFGVRLLGRNPGLTAVIVVVLAIAIAANTIVLSVVQAKLLDPLPYPNPDRLIQLWETNQASADKPSTISPFNFRDWQAENQTFEAMAVYAYGNFAWAAPDGVQRIRGVKVSAKFFEVFGVDPVLGRALDSRDDHPGSNAVALSYQAWQQRFGGDPGILGSTLILDGEPCTVVAVMPEDFQFPSPRTEVWRAPAFDLEGLKRANHFLFGIGRLTEAATLEDAQADLDVLAEQLEQYYPSTNQGSRVLLISLREQVVGDIRTEILLIWGGVTLVLMIACADLALLLMALMASRQGEVAIRRAMGGSRARIIRQLLTEGILLAFLGGGAGLALTGWATGYLASGRGPRILQSDRIEFNLWVLAFCAFFTLATAILSMIAPALQASRAPISSALQKTAVQGGRSTEAASLSRWLVAFQVSVAMVLLTLSGLLLKSLFLLHQVDTGFDPSGVTTVQLVLPSSKYPLPEDRAEVFRQVVERLNETPGVEQAAGVNDLPFSGSRTQNSFEIVGLSRPEGVSANADYRTIVGDYFGALHIDIQAGDSLMAQYLPDSPPVAVINQKLASRFFQGLDPIGRELIVQGRRIRVVGVVENLKHVGFAADAEPEIYVPAVQGQPPEWIYFVVRTALDPDALAPTMRRAVQDIVPEYPLFNFRTLEDRLNASIATQRFIGTILTLFAAMALLLVLIGIYGLISYGARRRSREIAIRMALGGERSRIVGLIVIGGFRPALLGIVVGAVLALPAARTLRSLLFGVGPFDPDIAFIVPVGLAIVAFFAGYIPARRATSIDPVRTLRDG
jgi:putative ABC transport system permease protein